MGLNTRDDRNNTFSITGTAAAPTLQLRNPELREEIRREHYS